jgi:mono/diheme cytochrome c family protein
MMRYALSTVVAFTLLAGFGSTARAQDQAQVRSTYAGVYSAVQAQRGADSFAGMCQACHSPEVHTGPAFLNAWGGRMLWELYAYISYNMPKNEPGTLAPQEYAQIVAYLLKLNDMPPGPQELPADSMALKAIRFDTAPPVRKASTR